MCYNKHGLYVEIRKKKMQNFLTANYHAHTIRCQHASGTEREYIEAAIAMGIREFGFSDHVPCPFRDGYVSGIRMTMEQAPEYVRKIRSLAREYQSDIRIYAGFEAEYIPEFYEEQKKLFRTLDVDYVIMGQHFWCSEDKGPCTAAVTGDESRIRSYVNQVIEGMHTGTYRYLAHPDIMNYRGMDSVYDWEMTRLCRAMKEMDIPIEINMLGLRENRHYPDERFWKIAGETGNRVILGIDAHCVEQIYDRETYEKGIKLVEKYHLDLINGMDMR